MNILKSRLVLACLLCIGSAGPAGAQPVRPEEKLVRLAYQKLAAFSRASLLFDDEGDAPAHARGAAVRFELRNFRVGPVREIMASRYGDLVTLPTGEIIRLVHTTSRLDGGEARVSYKAGWTRGQYASAFDPGWTVGHVLQLEPHKYFDVDGYASYEVTVSLDGRDRTYRALALFHNSYGASSKLRPEFWDTVVGMGGGITQAVRERRPPFGFDGRPSPGAGDSPAGADEYTQLQTELDVLLDGGEVGARARPGPGAPRGGHVMLKAGYTRPAPAGPRPAAEDPSGDCNALPTGNGSTIQWNCFGYEHHASGNHMGTARFTPSCTYMSDTQQRCSIALASVEWNDSGTVETLRYHVGNTALTQQARTGPTGSEVSCEAGAGVAFSLCINPTCGVALSVGVTGHGVEAKATISGGDLWRAAHAEGVICKLPTRVACPNRETRIAKCLALGEGWDDAGCRCAPDSPVIIDVGGDGIVLTDVEGGVNFDLNADGTAERLSWTAGGGADAFLVLDRDGNGRIESGAELFGNYTPQPPPPAGEAKNGFLALAELDKPTHGGNGDGLISDLDALFSALRLWRDVNHNGVSEPGELHPLPALGVVSLALDYREARKRDRHGNSFRYRARVYGAQHAELGPWAFDVFLVSAR